MGQNNNHKSNFHFLILGCKSFAVNYSLKSGTHRHHQTLGFIPGDALPGLYCNRLQFLLVLGAFSIQFCLQQVKCMLNRIQVRWLTWPLHNSPLLSLQNSLVAFAVCFGSLSICTVKRRPMSSEAFGWIWADNIARNTSEFILLLLSAVTSSINTREPVPLAAIHAHAMTLPPPCFTDEVVCLGSWAVPFLLHTLLFPSLWYKLILVSSVHRMLFQNCEGFFRCRLANSNLAFLFLRLTNGLHLVVNPLYSLWWSLLLIVDFDTHTPTSWRVFLIWPTVVKGVFFTRERILRSSTTVVFRGLPGLLVLLSSPVRSFFLRMFQTVVLATPNVFAISLMGLFCFFSLMMACFTDSDSSLDLILTVDSNRFQMQIAHLKWTLDLLSAHCNWDNEGITHTWPWNSWEANCPITFGPLTSGRHICKLL